MTMGISNQSLYDKMISGTLTRTDYVRAKMARSLSKHNKIETEALKIRRKLELENELKESLTSIAESCTNVQSLCQGFKTAKSSDETVVKFLDGDVNVAKDLTIKVNRLAEEVRKSIGQTELDRVGLNDDGKITLDSKINGGADVANGALLVKINEVEIRSSRQGGTYTMADLISEINSHTEETGVTAYFSSVLGRLVLEQDHITQWAKGHGNAAVYRFSDMLDGNGQEGGLHGADAHVTVTSLGETIIPDNYTLNGNILEIGGARFQLLQAQEGGEPCSFEIANGDANKVTDGVESFVDGLNTFLKKVNQLYNEEPDPKAELPTVEERESMTDEELTKREEKVCKGIFYHNRELRELAVNAGNIIKDLAGNMPGKDVWKTAIGLRGTDENGRLLSVQINKAELSAALTNGISQDGLKMSTDEVLKMLSGAKTERYSGGFLTRFADLCREQKDSYDQLGARGTGTASRNFETQQKLQDSLAAIEREEKRIVEQYNKRQAKIEAMEMQMFYLSSSWDAIMGAQYN